MKDTVTKELNFLQLFLSSLPSTLLSVTLSVYAGRCLALHCSRYHCRQCLQQLQIQSPAGTDIKNVSCFRNASTLRAASRELQAKHRLSRTAYKLCRVVMFNSGAVEDAVRQGKWFPTEGTTYPTRQSRITEYRNPV